jgi:hypothetical protein
MPGSPKECRERAEHCKMLAVETNNPVLRDSFADLANRWERIADDLECQCDLIEQWGSAKRC